MSEFCDQVKSEQARAILRTAIQGRGAFRQFKDQLRNVNLLDAWFQFRRDALAEIVKDWCEENSVTLRAPARLKP